MSFRTKADLIHLQQDFLKGEAIDADPGNVSAWDSRHQRIKAKKALVASFFSRSEVEFLLRRLDEMEDPIEFVKVFLVTNEAGEFTMAMCGADKQEGSLTAGKFPLLNDSSGSTGPDNFEWGLMANIDCPPRCQNDPIQRKENNLYIFNNTNL